MTEEPTEWDDSPLPDNHWQPVGNPLFSTQQTFSGQGAYPAWPQPTYSSNPALPQPTYPSNPAFPQPMWAPPSTPPQPPRHRNRRRTLLGWGIALALLVIIALVASLGVYIHRLGWEHTEYGYDVVERKTVDPAQPWVINLPIVITPPSSSVGIYTDPELLYSVPFATYSDALTITGRKLTLTPSSSTINVSDHLPQPPGPFTLGGDSWPVGTYYIVEWYDFLGQSLERPRVHVYTVQSGFSSPDFTIDVTDGVPTFTWESVEGVSAYYILKSTPSLVDDASLSVIGWTDGDATSWTSTAQDMDYEDLRQNEYDIDSYNAEFQGLDLQAVDNMCTPQDADYQGTTPPEWDDSMLTYPSYAVIATENNASTLPQFHNGRDIIVDTPISKASATLAQMNTDAGTDLFLPDAFPVTMGDCRTVFFPVTPRSFVTSADGTSNSLTYSVDGTRLTHSLNGSGDSYTTVANFGSGLRGVVQFGPMQDLYFMNPDQVKAFALGKTPSAGIPDTPYTWNGTSDMVRFIAANMFAGTEAIDMSRFTADPSNPLISDAANEAYYQNPYITDFSPIIGVRNDVLYISYEMTPEDRAASASRVKTKADQVLASIITDSMSEEDKASAINTYLAKNAVYDNDAADFNNGSHSRDEYVASYPNSWDAEGVLLYGKGVCSSYAAAYKVLADEAGLNSVTVTGWADTSGIGHEWIKVNIDGSWWVVDPTWDSNIWEQIRGNVDAFFMLTDAQADRTTFNGFVVDSHIADYDTP